MKFEYLHDNGCNFQRKNTITINKEPEKPMQVKRSNVPFFNYSSSDNINCHSIQATIK